MEDLQPSPYLLFTITDDGGNVVRRLKAPAKKGLNHMTWDFRTETKAPISFTSFDESFVFDNREEGMLVVPGTYKVSLGKVEDAVYTQLVAPQSFAIEALNLNSLAATDRKAVMDFGKKVMELHRAADATGSYAEELANKLKYMNEAALQTPSIDPSVIKRITDLQRRLTIVNTKLNGDATLAKREFETPSSIQNRIGSIMGGLISTTSAPTTTFMNSYNVAATQFADILTEVTAIDGEVKQIEGVLERAGAPYTPGRLPQWKKE